MEGQGVRRWPEPKGKAQVNEESIRGRWLVRLGSFRTVQTQSSCISLPLSQVSVSLLSIPKFLNPVSPVPRILSEKVICDPYLVRDITE